MKQILRNIFRSSFVYVLLMVQLGITFTLILLGVDARIAIDEMTARYTPYRDLNLASVGVTGLNDGPTIPDSAVDVDGINIIEFDNLRYVLPGSEYLSDYTIAKCNSGYFEDLIGFPAEKDTIYCSHPKEVIQNLKSAGNRVFPYGQVIVGDDTIQILGKKYSVKPFPVSPKAPIIPNSTDHRHKDLHLDRDLLMLYEPGIVIGEDPDMWSFIHYRRNLVDGKWLTNEVYKTYQDGRMVFLSDLYSDFQNTTKHDHVATTFAWIGLISVFIVALGLTGILMVVMERRRFTNSIVHIHGASMRKLRFMLFFEVALVYFLPLVVSLVLRDALEAYYRAEIGATYLIEPTWWSSALVSGLAVVLMFMSVSLSVSKLKDSESLIQTLR